MLGNTEAVANIAVKDLKTAGRFYRDTLGLQQIASEGDDLLVLKSGSTKVIVYRSDYAGTNQATTITWTVGPNLEEVVNELKSKGVTFEHYDIPGVAHQGDVHVSGDVKIVWFKDPDGNILNLVNG